MRELLICFISVHFDIKIGGLESLFDQVNGEVLGTVTSQFIRYSFDLPSLKGLNRLEVGEMIFRGSVDDVDTGLFMFVHYIRLYGLLISDLNIFCF